MCACVSQDVKQNHNNRIPIEFRLLFLYFIIVYAIRSEWVSKWTRSFASVHIRGVYIIFIFNCFNVKFHFNWFVLSSVRSHEVNGNVSSSFLFISFLSLILVYYQFKFKVKEFSCKWINRKLKLKRYYYTCRIMLPINQRNEEFSSGWKHIECH